MVRHSRLHPRRQHPRYVFVYMCVVLHLSTITMCAHDIILSHTQPKKAAAPKAAGEKKVVKKPAAKKPAAKKAAAKVCARQMHYVLMITAC